MQVQAADTSIIPHLAQCQQELETQLREDEGRDLGYMEYFDWLAGCSDEELLYIGKQLGVIEQNGSFPAGSPAARHEVGLKIWSRM